jgi:MFS family permease
VATLTMFVIGSTFLFTVVFLPLYMVNVLGISVTRAGLSLTPLTLGMVTTSVLAGQIASRLGGVKTLLIGALATLAVAFAIMGFTLSPDATQGEVTLKMILIGLGMGPTLPLYTLLVQNASRPRDVGVVTAGSIFSRAIGQVIGLALFGTLFAASLTGGLAAGTDAVLGRLPEAVQAIVREAVPALSQGGESIDIDFDAEGVRARIAAAPAGADVAPGPGPTGGLPSISEADRADALDAVDEMELAYARSLTDATTLLYRIGIGLVLVSLALTAMIPGDGRYADNKPSII